MGLLCYFNLQPIVKNFLSYLRGTTDFLQKLDKVKNIPNDCLLVILDLKSLYANTPNNEAIKDVREAYDNHSSNINEVVRSVLNFFIFFLHKLVF